MIYTKTNKQTNKKKKGLSQKKGFNSSTITTKFNSNKHGASSFFRNKNGFFKNEANFTSSESNNSSQ